MTKKRVVIVYKSLPKYRIKFFDSLRLELQARGINLDLIYGDASGADATKQDTADLPWAVHRRSRSINLRGRQLVWQPVIGDLRDVDLIIVEQANKLLINNWLLVQQRLGGSPVAFWGHGANLQVHTANRASEFVKGKLARLPHWWFAYTEGSKRRVERLGFPPHRISVVQNAIDTRSLHEATNRISDHELSGFRTQYALTAGRVGLFMGSLYEEKRLEFLMESAVRTAAALPGFKLLVAGDGPQQALVRRHAETSDIIYYLGRVDGRQKVLALRAADVFLMPGLVGLAVLDAFAAGAPVITTDIDYHSPEIEYLRSGYNGIILDRNCSSYDFGEAVAATLADDSLMDKLRAGCLTGATNYTNEAMVRNFAEGVVRALSKVHT